MTDSLDFEDINNYLHLTNETNLWIAKHYTHVNLLTEAEAVPQLKRNPETSMIIQGCIDESYNPLSEIEAYEGIMASFLTYAQKFLQDTKKLGITDLEVIISKAEWYANSMDCPSEKDDELTSFMFYLGKLSQLSKRVFAIGKGLRKFYSELAIGVNMLAPEFKINPFDMLEEPSYTDELTRLMFPTSKAAKSFFTTYKLSLVPIHFLIKDLNERLTSSEQEVRVFSELASDLPPKSELSEAFELHSQYVEKDMDRIYSAQK